MFRKFLLLAMVSGTFAANHYVSNTGTASWAISTNIATPCSTRVAFDSAQAGDTAFFLQGTYNTPERNFGNTYSGYYYPKHSGTSSEWIVFIANPGDSVIFNGTTGGSADDPEYATIFWTNSKSYIVFDGFSFRADNGSTMARVMVGTDEEGEKRDIQIKNCIFYGGTTIITSSDNREGLRIERSKNVTVNNCYFYNYRETHNDYNICGIKTYHDTVVVVENCEFYNNSHGINFKSEAYRSKVINCYFHDNYRAFLCDGNMIVMSTDSLDFHNNLVINSEMEGFIYTGGGADSGTHGDDWLIYNNTFYNNGSSQISLGYVTPGGHGMQFYNNIVTGAASISLKTQDMSNWRNYLKACDHNQWGESFKTIYIGENYRNINYTTLANWQASNELENAMDAGCGSSQHPGCGDLSSDPQFVNASGNMNELADFALGGASPCLGAGRSGADIGADVSTVGLDYVPDEEEPPTRTWHDSTGLSYTDSISSTDKNSFYVSAKNKTSGPKIRVFINLLGQKIDSTAILNNADSSAVSISNAVTGTYYIVKKSVR
jgi:hypothetical protein